MKDQIYKYLKDNPMMSLATSVDNKPWACTVFQMVDTNLDMYFMSSGESQHIKKAVQNPNVACSIADSSQRLSTKNKIGMQITGAMSEVSKLDSLKVFLRLWKKLDAINSDYTLEEIMKAGVYVIKPTKFKYMNKDLFGKETYGILDLD